MKSTDRQLFLRHQRRCVKCRQLQQVHAGQVVDHDVLVLLRLHDSNVRLLYHQGMPQKPLGHLSEDLPGD